MKAEMEILRKNQQEMLEIKNTETEMNVSDGLTWLSKVSLSLRYF